MLAALVRSAQWASLIGKHTRALHFQDGLDAFAKPIGFLIGIAPNRNIKRCAGELLEVGSGNAANDAPVDAPIQCRARLGGTLSYYYRDAA